jgi:hypothetical protein
MIESSARFRNLTLRLLEREGALTEKLMPDGLQAVLPAALQTSLGAGELLRLGFGPELPDGALRAGLESDWLEKIGGLLGARGRTLRLALGVGRAAPPPPERLLERTVALTNAVYRFQGMTSAWTRYLILVFRYTAVSDEKREGIVKLAVNLANGSVAEGFMEELLVAALAETHPSVPPSAQELPADWTPAKLRSWTAHTLPDRVRAPLGLFLGGMQRRLDRDLERIFNYHESLSRESFARQRKQKADPAREQMRIEAVAREYHAKIADLKQKYGLRVVVELSQRLEVVAPVERVHLSIKRRKGERRITLDWNPVARRLEPLPDEWSYSALGPRSVCDDALHLMAASGLAPCGECRKEFCRVCHGPQCPRCRETAAAEVPENGNVVVKTEAPRFRG